MDVLGGGSVCRRCADGMERGMTGQDGWLLCSAKASCWGGVLHAALHSRLSPNQQRAGQRAGGRVGAMGLCSRRVPCRAGQRCTSGDRLSIVRTRADPRDCRPCFAAFLEWCPWVVCVVCVCGRAVGQAGNAGGKRSDRQAAGKQAVVRRAGPSKRAGGWEGPLGREETDSDNVRAFGKNKRQMRQGRAEQGKQRKARLRASQCQERGVLVRRLTLVGVFGCRALAVQWCAAVSVGGHEWACQSSERVLRVARMPRGPELQIAEARKAGAHGSCNGVGNCARLVWAAPAGRGGVPLQGCRGLEPEEAAPLAPLRGWDEAGRDEAGRDEGRRDDDEGTRVGDEGRGQALVSRMIGV